MKGKLGIFLFGVVTALLLDPASGAKRRARVNTVLGPAVRRLQGTKDQIASSDLAQTARESAVPTMLSTVQRAASTVQDRVGDAVDAVGDKFSQMQPGAVKGGSGGDAPSEEQPAMSPEELRAEVTPRSNVDPIPEHDPNDPTLVARVESELFRDATLPKGDVNIDAANGIVTLRGTVKETVADDLLSRTRAIEGVDTVVDLLKRN